MVILPRSPKPLGGPMAEGNSIATEQLSEGPSREEILSDSFMYNLSEDETGFNFDHGHVFWVL